MTRATGLAAVILLTVGGCNSGSDGAAPTPSPSTSGSPTPTAPKTLGKADLVGDWQARDAEWTVHFHDDGTFVEDFQGLIDFRVGTYDVDGESVSLIGDDGNTITGTITGVTLVFRLGTLIKD